MGVFTWEEMNGVRSGCSELSRIRSLVQSGRFYSLPLDGSGEGERVFPVFAAAHLSSAQNSSCV